MKRDVTSHLDALVTGPATLIYSVAVARSGATVEETLELTVDGQPVTPVEIADHQGSRLHRLDLVAEEGQERAVVLDYSATITGQGAPAPASNLDRLELVRPSRYCESDTLAPTAAAEFGSLEGEALLVAVSQWVHDELAYVSGSSLPTDGAVRTLLARQGVCRDFAHLTTALLRARDVPARLVSVYAPGLSPMDFHAVTEAYVDGAWRLVDATWLAPRTALVRIATGRDAADTAFLTNYGGQLQLREMSVTAVIDELPDDDWTGLVELR